MENEAVMSMTPFIGVISQIIGWSFFIAVLVVLKNFISHGFSMAIAEVLLKTTSIDVQQKMVRWFGNGDVVLEKLNEINERIKSEQRGSS